MSKFKNAVIEFSIRSYKFIAIAIVLLTLAAGAFIPLIQIDTDPENMLEKTEPVRVFHNQSKKTFDLSETIVLGVINDSDPDGVFNPATLKRVHELTEFAKTLRWDDEKNPGKSSGVIEAEMIAPSLVDHLSQQGAGIIRFEWLMPHPPETRGEALEIRDKALSNPLLKGHMISEDGKALCIYLPLTDKLLSYKVYRELARKIKEMGDATGEEYHIAGLPVAESAIGVEMFSQMTLAAPLTMLVIFGLLFVFFRKWVLIILPMIVATVSVVSSLGLMIAFGFPVHILSSMLPIFLMPIAICDSVHILSDFLESYSKEKGRSETIRQVMNSIFAPVLYTSLTTAAGFLSFLTTSIPPARVFGFFVAVGVIVAWFATILLVPAYIMLIPERMLENLGGSAGNHEKQPRLSGFLNWLGRAVYTHAKSVAGIIALLIVAAVWGISHININDNYAKRFSPDHPIRKADTAINSHFGGTYTAYLIMEGKSGAKTTQSDIQRIEKKLDGFASRFEGNKDTAEKIALDIKGQLYNFALESTSFESFIDSALRYTEEKASGVSYVDSDVLQELKDVFIIEKEYLKTFKRPDVLEYLAGLQAYMENEGLVGKTTSAADVVRKINQELVDGKEENFRIPHKLEAVSECYMQYQQGHRPNDLWHLVTPDFMTANIWMQFKTGDSTRTEKAVKAVEDYIRKNAPPVELSLGWAGLHYVNLVFQDKMFVEMLESFAGSFIIVFVMMIFLFRSLPWAVACMIPLSLTIAAIYGATGIVGKDYDMPVAVIGAISLGIAVDFAIHFLERSRQFYIVTGSWEKTVPKMFEEPALAISRNVLVVAIGFLPLMIAQLVPYKTTAVMLFAVLFFSGLVTLTCLPALLTIMERLFFRNKSAVDEADEVYGKKEDVAIEN